MKMDISTTDFHPLNLGQDSHSGRSLGSLICFNYGQKQTDTFLLPQKEPSTRHADFLFLFIRKLSEEFITCNIHQFGWRGSTFPSLLFHNVLFSHESLCGEADLLDFRNVKKPFFSVKRLTWLRCFAGKQASREISLDGYCEHPPKQVVPERISVSEP